MHNGAKIQIVMLIHGESKVRQQIIYIMTQNYLFAKRVLIVWEQNLHSTYTNLFIH